MRNTVFLFSFTILIFSFLSCKGKQQNTTDVVLSVNPSTELVQQVSDDLVQDNSGTESDSPAFSKVSVPKTQVSNPTPEITETKVAETSTEERQEPKPVVTEISHDSPSVNETKVSKSPETVEPVKPVIEPEEEEMPKPTISHESWDQLLKKYVTASGKVNYKGFKMDQAKFQAYLEHLKSNPPQADWSRNKIRAYWINAYNAFTVKTILDNYPLKSIRDLSKPWDKAFINIGGKSYSLNDIEHKILRAKYFDSRIHFAVNCASFSCPKILNRAFTESNVSAQMHALAVAYINDPKHNKISPDKAELSQLFEWYKEDFTKKGSLIDYINKYSKVKLNPDAQISYMPYNWNLNE